MGSRKNSCSCGRKLQEVAGSNPVAPTFFRKKPFGKNVEGLSYFRDGSCAVEVAVQTHDFEDSPLRIVTGRKTLLAKGLRKFIHLGSQFRRFVVRAVQRVGLELDRGNRRQFARGRLS